MKKQELKEKTDKVVEQTKEALQIMYDALNQGQQKKILRDEKVKELFDRYEVNYEE